MGKDSVCPVEWCTQSLKIVLANSTQLIHSGYVNKWENILLSTDALWKYNWNNCSWNKNSKSIILSIHYFGACNQVTHLPFIYVSPLFLSEDKVFSPLKKFLISNTWCLKTFLFFMKTRLQILFWSNGWFTLMQL